MVDHHVGNRTHIMFAEGANQSLKLRAIPVEGFDGTLLVEVAEVEVVVWIVAIRCSSRTLAEGGKPERADTGSCELGNLLGKVVPPLALFAFLDWRIPVKCLHHHCHERCVLSALRESSRHPQLRENVISTIEIAPIQKTQ